MIHSRNNSVSRSMKTATGSRNGERKEMKFTKMQGCGNDYIYVNCFEENVQDPSDLAVKLSDRRYGIGSDGLILIEPSDRADAFMHMFNRDGSEGKMCGNGIRCVAKYIYDNGIVPPERKDVLIDTKAGLREIRLDIKDGKAAAASVDMGIAEVAAEPENIAVGGIDLCFTAVSTGNPHAVFFLDDNPALSGITDEDTSGGGGDCTLLSRIPLEIIGPEIESSGRFPDGVNAEFVEMISPEEICFRVWERGSGETYACGTGATAAVAAGCFAGKLACKVLVHLRGGDLEIECDIDTGRCIMTGPAVTVFTGELL